MTIVGPIVLKSRCCVIGEGLDENDAAGVVVCRKVPSMRSSEATSWRPVIGSLKAQTVKLAFRGVIAHRCRTEFMVLFCGCPTKAEARSRWLLGKSERHTRQWPRPSAVAR